jgi:formylglycine-generating enzyme required for sulfatase activity
LAPAAVFALQPQLSAQLTATFGSGGNQFTMDFVTIGNPGNLADTSPAGWGAVATTFYMGKYEVSRDMITKASSAGSLGITLADMSSYGGNGVDRPATGVSWNEAARFVNWLNTSQGYSAAYKFAVQPGGGGYDANANIQLWASGDAGYNAANPYRNSLAHYFLPSENEWYKAAYYNGVAGVYYDYPTGSDTAPTAVASGTGAGTAVFGQTMGKGPADIVNAGGVSPYGTMGQGGNVWEWNESAYDGGNNVVDEERGLRGGRWSNAANGLGSSYRDGSGPTLEGNRIGFRVAVVPEPMESAGVIGVAALGFALWRRRGSL